MPQLGELKYAFRGYNNEAGDIEIIMPNSMVLSLDMLVYKDLTIKNFEIVDEKLVCQMEQSFSDRVLIRKKTI